MIIKVSDQTVSLWVINKNRMDLLSALEDNQIVR